MTERRSLALLADFGADVVEDDPFIMFPNFVSKDMLLFFLLLLMMLDRAVKLVGVENVYSITEQPAFYTTYIILYTEYWVIFCVVGCGSGRVLCLAFCVVFQRRIRVESRVNTESSQE